MKAHKQHTNNNHGERIAVLETNMSNVIVGLNDIKQELRSINEKMENRFNKLESRMWQLYVMSMGVCSGLFYLIAHANKWIGS